MNMDHLPVPGCGCCAAFGRDMCADHEDAAAFTEHPEPCVDSDYLTEQRVRGLLASANVRNRSAA